MLRKAFRSNVIYAVGSVANSAALLLIVPFLVNSLTPTEFGTWSLLEVGILLLNLFILLGLDIGFMREYYALASEEARRRLAGTVIASVTLWGVLLVSALAGVSLVTGWDRLIDSPVPALLLAMFSALVEAVFSLSLNLFRIREEPVKFVVLSLGRLVFFMIGSIALVKAGQGLTGAIAGRALAGSAALVAGMVLARRYFRLSFDPAYLKRVARYGLPLLPTNLAAYILLASDRYFLQFYLSASVVGVYSFAYKIVSVFDILVNRPFALDWAPRRFKIAGLHDAPKRYATVLIVYFFVGILVALVIVALTPYVYEWFAPDTYRESLTVVPVLLLAALIYGLSYPLNIGIVIKDKTHYAAIIGVTAALLCLGFNFWLIPRFGMLGAAWATVVSYLAWTGGMTIVSLRLYPVHYPRKELLVVCGAAVLGYIGLQWSTGPGPTPSLWLLIVRLSWLAILFGAAGAILIKSMPKMREEWPQQDR